MKLILARHGNTFAPEAKPFWVGRSQDLPLVAEGEAQARRLGQRLQQSNGLKLGAIYCGPLQRTRSYAELVSGMLPKKLSPQVDQRLDELDYGIWSGRTDQEIRDLGLGLELDSWAKRGEWPSECRWKPGREQVIAELTALISDLEKCHASDETVLLVSSNGRLRFFLALPGIQGSFSEWPGAGKMKTGHVSTLPLNQGHCAVEQWGVEPAELSL